MPIKIPKQNLTPFEIEQNKLDYITLLRSIQRDGSQIDQAIKFLEDSDFFIAPASTRYHANFKGGLCYHSLNVYKRYKNLMDNEFGDLPFMPIDRDGILLVALTHDWDKINTYEEIIRNRKNNNNEWESYTTYNFKHHTKRFVYGPHSLNSLVLTEQFFPLTKEECICILYHMGGKDAGDEGGDQRVSEAFNFSSSAVLLHTADMMATFIDEKVNYLNV